VPRPHPAFFDRPLDHYPGMLLAEAARQLAASSLAADVHVPVTSVCTDYAAMDFVSFAELDTPPTMTVVDWIDLDDGAELTVGACQDAQIRSTYKFRMSHDGYSEDRS
jgi:hypothetical protein